MNFLFSHRNFPAQFRHILLELAKDPDNKIVFLTNTRNNLQIKNVQKVYYTTKREVPKNCHRYLRQYEESIIHGQAASETLIQLKNQGFRPDVIYAHMWGNSMFFKDIFPDTPLISYCEWYYNSKNSDCDFNPDIKQTYDSRAKTRCKNAQFLLDLVSSDLGICPTNWQKAQFPKEFHNKIQVIHDGIDTSYFIPDDNAEFKIPNTDIKLSKNDNVITYATRGMEEYRGFPEFMKAVEKLQKTRDDLHFVIAGEDRVCYGRKLDNDTFKNKMLRELDLDLSKIHFTGSLPYGEYKKLLQISSCHIYLTYPFVLSWSLLEAMSMQCAIVASDTEPVKEVIKDNENGLLIPFYDIEQLSQKITHVIDNKNTKEIKEIKERARQTVVDKYDLQKLLPRHVEMVKRTARHILHNQL